MNLTGYTDKPVGELGQDILGISSYVEGLYLFISECDTPMTISIQGDWGSGKTSLMNMIRDRMSSSKILTVWFNTWQFSQYGMDEALPICMLNSLLKDLSVDEENKKGIIGDLFGATAGLMKFGSMIMSDKVLGGTLTDKIFDTLKSAEPLEHISETLKKLKNAYQEAINQKLLAEGKDRIVVFVDDLDRLQPLKAVELLEAIKIFLDCENCVYLLAVDYEIIQQGITQKFGNGVDPRKGKNFFDKIVQLPFKMPVEQYDIEKYVTNMLGKMSIGYVSTYTGLIKCSIGCNPRSMKRLFNTFQLLNIIISKHKFNSASHKPEILNKVLFATLCMQMEFDTLYKIIAASPNALDCELLTSLSESEKLQARPDLRNDFEDLPNDSLEKMFAFMKIFLEAIKVNPTEEIQQSGIDVLKSVLFFTSMTSVSGSMDVREQSDREWDIRYKNKSIVQNLNEYVKTAFNYDFEVYQSRKDWPGWKISDTSGYCDLRDSFAAEYIIKRDFSSRNLQLSLSIKPIGTLAKGKIPVTINSFDRIEKSGAESYLRLDVANHSIPVNDDDIDKIVKAFKPYINEFMKILQKNFPIGTEQAAG